MTHTVTYADNILPFQCMADIGRSLRLLGIQKGPDPPAQWRVQQIVSNLLIVQYPVWMLSQNKICIYSHNGGRY